MERWPFGIKVVALVCAGSMLGLPLLLTAQQPPGPVPAQAQQAMGPDQLDDLVAPVALYPDPLLGQVLAASTYPLEVVEAQQWLQNNRGLNGKPLMDAALQQNWDASVQALVAFPDAMNMLSGNVQWTTELGNTFLAQQADVMAAVQRMRARAEANGKLQTTSEERVATQVQEGQRVIEIVPSDPEVIYVPSYNPLYVWGPPAWGYYPALDYGFYGYGFWPGIDIGLCFGGWGGWGGWGWGPNWFGNSIFLNASFFHRHGFRGPYFGGGFAGGFTGLGIWQHDPAHRLGVTYPNRQLAGRYQSASMASRAAMSRPAMGTAPTTTWNRFGPQGAASQGSRNGAPQNMARGSQVGPNQAGQWQRFQGAQGSPATARGQAMPQQRYQTPQQQRQAMPQQRNQAPQQRGQAVPQQRYQAPQQQRQAMPQQRYQAAPSVGGGSRSLSGGGGGARSSGGGSGGHR